MRTEIHHPRPVKCRLKAFGVVAVIELDDKSHKGREAADAARDEILQGAGYRVLRYSRTPSTEQLRKDLGLEAPVPGRQE